MIVSKFLGESLQTANLDRIHRRICTFVSIAKVGYVSAVALILFDFFVLSVLVHAQSKLRPFDSKAS